MNKKTIRDGFEYYVEIDETGGEEYEYQMLLVNQISCILPLHVRTVKEKRHLIYQASGYKSLGNGFEKTMVSGEQILCIMEGIMDGADSVKKYLLSPNNLVLDEESIFMDYDYKKVALIYVPGYDQDMIAQLRGLMEYLVGKIKHTEIKSVMLTWKLYVLLREEHVSLQEIRKILESFRGTCEELEWKEASVIESHQRGRSSLSLGRERETDREEKEQKREKKEKFIKMKNTKKAGQKKTGQKNRDKIWKIRTPATLLLLISVILLAALCLTEAAFLHSIYAFGITEWKRNLLLLNSFLLLLTLGMSLYLWKKERLLRTLRMLREKSEGKT